MRTFSFFNFIRNVEYSTTCASGNSVFPKRGQPVLQNTELSTIRIHAFLEKRPQDTTLHTSPGLSERSLWRRRFGRGKQNAHKVQSFQHRSSGKMQKPVFIRKWGAKGQEASESPFASARATSEVRGWLLREEEHFVTGGCFLVLATRCTAEFHSKLFATFFLSRFWFIPTRGPAACDKSWGDSSSCRVIWEHFTCLACSLFHLTGFFFHLPTKASELW